MGYFYDDFNYPDGDLNGNGGWAGATEFKVLDGQAYCNVGGGDTRSILKSGLYLDVTKDITVYGKVGFENKRQCYTTFNTYDEGSGNRRTGIMIFITSGQPSYLKIYRWCPSAVDYKFLGNRPFTPGEIYDWSYTYYVGEQFGAGSKYLSFIFNGYDFGEQALSVPPLGYLNRVNMVHYRHSFDNTVYYNSLGAKNKKSKYTYFPRWQKTKYGLRPFY